MAAIQNLEEPWAGHTFEEIEDFVNTQLDEIDEILDNYEYQKSLEQYLTIEATEDGTALSWLFPSGFNSSYAKTIQYSTDDGLTWNSVLADVEDYGNLGMINKGQRVILRGIGATGFYDNDQEEFAGNFLYANNPCYVYGNAMSLLYGANFANETSVPEYALTDLFSDYNEGISGEWVLSKEGSPIVLPATTLENCCYANMFWGCTSLTTAPELPATILVRYCYSYMFCGCTSLTSVKCLASDIGHSAAVNYWLDGVAATGTFTKAAGVEWPTGASGIPSGWTVQTDNE